MLLRVNSSCLVTWLPPPLPSQLPSGLDHVLCAPVPPEAFITDRWTDETPDLILPTTRARPSLIPWSETRFYPSVKAGRLISAQIGEQGMRLSGLVWGQYREVEKPVSINRSRDLQGGDSGSSVLLSRVKLCFSVWDRAERSRASGFDITKR